MRSVQSTSPKWPFLETPILTPRQVFAKETWRNLMVKPDLNGNSEDAAAGA
jgi:hypothetical protein